MSAAEPTWIALIPAPDDAAWIAALHTTAAAASRAVVLYGADTQGGNIGVPLDLVLDTMRFRTEAAGVVLAPDVTDVAAAASRRYGLGDRQGLWVGSRLLAEACALPGARWIIDPAPGSAVSLSPALSVTVPAAPALTPPRSPFASAAATALRLFQGGPPGVGSKSRWDPALFDYSRSRPATGPHIGAVDITGRARILVSGPHFALPTGRWRAVVRFDIDPAAASLGFRLEWGDDVGFAHHRFTPGRAGRFELELSHDWAAAAPAEIRLILETATIDGLVTFNVLDLDRTA